MPSLSFCEYVMPSNCYVVYMFTTKQLEIDGVSCYLHWANANCSHAVPWNYHQCKRSWITAHCATVAVIWFLRLMVAFRKSTCLQYVRGQVQLLDLMSCIAVTAVNSLLCLAHYWWTDKSWALMVKQEQCLVMKLELVHLVLVNSDIVNLYLE